MPLVCEDRRFYFHISRSAKQIYFCGNKNISISEAIVQWLCRMSEFMNDRNVNSFPLYTERKRLVRSICLSATIKWANGLLPILVRYRAKLCFCRYIALFAAKLYAERMRPGTSVCVAQQCART